jgi:hypothetical protein
MKRTTRIGTGLGVGVAAFAAAGVMAVASPAASVAAADGATTAPTATSAPAGGCQGKGKELLTGDDAVKATAAAEAAVEGGTVLRVTVDPDGAYQAHVRNSEDTLVEVTMDDTFTVTGVEELPARGHGGPRGHGGGPDRSDADEDGASAESTASQTMAA